MKKLTYTEKLPGRSIAEVRERYDAALLAHQKGRTLLFGRRKLTAEAFTNAVILHFLGLPETEQRAILEEYVPKFSAMLEAGGEAEPAPGKTATLPIKPPTDPPRAPVEGQPIAFHKAKPHRGKKRRTESP